MRNLRQEAWLPWAAIALLAVLCGVLAVLQYRWIGEIAGAERTRLREALEEHLNTVGRTLNDELSSSANALMAPAGEIDRRGREAAYSAQYLRWRESHERLFRRIAIAVPDGESFHLLMIDSDTGRIASADWPVEWNAMRDRLTQIE